MWGQTYSWWASRVVWKIIFLYCLFSPGCRWNKSWSAVRRKGAAWHAGVWAPSEVISHHCLSKRKHQHIPKTRAKGAFRLAFGHICKNMINNSTAASQLVNATATYHRISQHFFHFMCWNFCQLFLLQKKAEAFFFLLLQLYLYQRLSRRHCCQYCVCLCCDVCFASLSFFWCPCSPFAFVMSVSVFHSSSPALESDCSVSFTYRVFDVWPVVLLPLCSWYHVSVFLVISVFFMAFWCWCFVHSGLSHRHLWFYLCIIFRVISALLSICYHMPQSRWWPFSLTAL